MHKLLRRITLALFTLSHTGSLWAAELTPHAAAPAAKAVECAQPNPEGDPGVDACQERIPGGDQFIPGGDQFIPGGDQFIPGGDQFIPGGDQFSPSPQGPPPGALKIDDELPEGIPGGDQFIPGGDQFDAQNERTINPSFEDPRLDQKITLGTALCSWTGTWGTTYGTLRLHQSGSRVHGDYGINGYIDGEVGADCSLRGRFDNRREALTGSFTFRRVADRFEGEWGLNEAAPSTAWNGRRTSTDLPELKADTLWSAPCLWTGTWFTPWAGIRLRLVQNGSEVTGELGGDETFSGTTTTECVGQRNVSLSGSLTDRETGATRSLNITMSGRHYTGSIGRSSSERPYAATLSGSRASTDTPALRFSAAQTPRASISDAGGTVERAVEPAQPSDRSIVARYEVNLGQACMSRRGTQLIAPNEKLVGGIAWVRARVYDKTTGQEVELAPVGGFPNLNGDKERAWEVRPQRESGVNRSLEFGRCRNLTDIGYVNRRSPVRLVFEFDPTKYGYKDIDELLDRRRNRIRIMYKFFGIDYTLTDFGVGDDMGTKVRSHNLRMGDICGTCKASGWTAVGGSAPTGDGVFSGYSDGHRSLFVLYDLKRLEDRVM